MIPAIESIFLTKDQIWGDTPLEVIQSYGTQTQLTDLAIILGGLMSASSQAGYVWSASLADGCNVCIASSSGNKGSSNPKDRHITARPALSTAITSCIYPDKVRIILLLNGNRVQAAQWGEYPQRIASDIDSIELDKHFKNKTLRMTGNQYTFDSVDPTKIGTEFKPLVCQEYTLYDNNYIRVHGKPADTDSILSNGRSVKEGDAYWVQVKPIEWLMDKTGIWVSRNALFAGIQFDVKKNEDFSKTFMKSYLDTYFTPEMIQHLLGHEDQSKITQQVKEMTVKDIKNLPQQDPDLLQKLVIAKGLLEETFEHLNYEQKKALYSKTYNNEALFPEQKKAMEQSILKSREQH